MTRIVIRELFGGWAVLAGGKQIAVFGSAVDAKRSVDDLGQRLGPLQVTWEPESPMGRALVRALGGES